MIRTLKTLSFALNIQPDLRLETMRIARDAHAHYIEHRGPVFFVASAIDAGRSASGAAGARAVLRTVECLEMLTRYVIFCAHIFLDFMYGLYRFCKP